MAGAQMTDPRGDVQATGGPSPTGVPANPQTDLADLLGLVVEEQDLAFTFRLQAAGLGQAAGTTAHWTIPFTWMDAGFQVHLVRTMADPTATARLQAWLEQWDGARYGRILTLTPVEDAATSTLSVELAKNAIVSLEGHAPVYGSVLANVTVRSWVEAEGGPLRFADQMPDGAPGTILYERGGSANGHLTLEAPDPVRVSNGAATTFVFQAHMQNRGSETDTATLELRGIPAGWEATVQPAQAVPPGDERPIFAVVSVPFAHQHGGFLAFDLVATSQRDPSVTASIRFGVLYTPIAMPAGHHPTVYLHASPTVTGATAPVLGSTANSMNTVETHDEDAPQAFPASSTNGTLEWSIPLAPLMALGLDFDLNRTGNLHLQVASHRSGPGSVAAQLWLARADSRILPLTEAARVDAAWDPQAPTALDLPLRPTPDADYVAYSPGQNLLLVVTAAAGQALPCCLGAESTPTLDVANFRMDLPLDEYADRPVWDPGIESTLRIDVHADVQRPARPGTTIVYNMTLTNRAGPDAVALSLAGSGTPVSTLFPNGTLEVPGGKAVTLQLAVRVPSDAAASTRFETLVVARSGADPSNIAIGRVVTVADPAARNADEGQAFKDASQKKETPLPLAAALAGAVLAAAVGRRRKARAH